MLKLKHLMPKVRGNYNSCTGKSSENICSSTGGAQERGGSKQDESQFITQKWCIYEVQPHP